MIAPLMTCSARLPVYALLIGAFVPDARVGPFNLRGLVLFALYVAGVVSAMARGLGLQARLDQEPLPAADARAAALPRAGPAQPRARPVGARARSSCSRVGSIILALMVVLWFLSSFPAPPAGATGPAIQYSIAGWLGQALQHVFAPIGFNWQISIALVPGLAAREVAVGALGTVYSMSAAGDAVADALSPVIAQGWSLATA